MAERQFQSVIDYLRLTGSTVHEEHLTTIRDRYRQVLQLAADVPLPDEFKEDKIAEVARQLNLQIDTDEARDYLQDCVIFADINDARNMISIRLAGEVQPMAEIIFKPIDPPTRPTPTMKPNRSSVLPNFTTLTEIDCLLNIKMQAPEVDQFIHTFLLQDAKLLHQPITT